MSLANSSLVGILIIIGDVTDIFAIQHCMVIVYAKTQKPFG